MPKLSFRPGRVVLTVVALVLPALLASAPARATSAPVDVTFGNSGVWNPAPECCGESRANAIAMQADGKLIAAGASSTGFIKQVAVIRSNADGTIDSSFGTAGSFQLPLSALSSEAQGVAVLGDGSIVVAGNYLDDAGGSQAFILKLTSAGQLDTTFGAAGIVRLVGIGPNATSTVARALALQPDGKVLVAGRLTLPSGDTDMFVTRISANGALDSSFGFNATATSGFTGVDEAYALAVAPDASIVLAGEANISGSVFPALMQVLPDGSFDPALNATGRMMPAVNFAGTFRAVAVQPDGKILAGGRLSSTPTTLRLQASGALDSTYNGTGAQQGYCCGYVTAIALMPDGRHMVSVEPSAAFYANVYRVLPGGGLDPGWSSATQVPVITKSDQDLTSALLVSASGETWLGSENNVLNGALLLARLSSTGALAGQYLDPLGFATPKGELRAVAQDASGRIYVVRPDGYLMRVTPQGQTDTTFGTGGKVALPAGATTAVVAVRPDGKIYYAVPNIFIHSCAWSVQRLNADGSADASFTPVLAGACGQGQEPHVLPYPGAAGKVLIWGFTSLGRYLDDGSPDPAFNFGSTVAGAAAAAISPSDGAIYTVFSDSVRKIMPDGGIDPAYGSSSVVQIHSGTANIDLRQVTVDASGRAVVAGVMNAVPQQIFFARLTTSGALDPTFGSAGISSMFPPDASLTSSAQLAGLFTDNNSNYVLGGTLFRSDGSRHGFILRASPSGVIGGLGSPTITYLQGSAQNDTISAFAPDISGTGILAAGMTDAPPGDVPNPGSGRSSVVKLLSSGSYALQLAPSQFTVGGLNVPYSYRLAATPGTGPYTYAVVSGTLPPGLLLTGDTLAGTPTAAGVYDFAIQVTDANGLVGANAYTFTVFDEATLVEYYYENILGRGADAAGLAFWQSEADRMVRDGASVSDAFFNMAMAFFNSDEYRQRNRGGANFITDLYRTFFNRDPDAAGLDYWLGQSGAGEPYPAMVNDFLFSPEFASFMGGVFGSSATSRPEVSMVLDFYRGILGRLPDDSGLAFWAGKFKAAQCDGTVAAQANAISAQFIASPEYAARLNARTLVAGNSIIEDYLVDDYNAFLRRGVDLPGYMYWVGQMRPPYNLSAEQVRQQFVASPEFTARVAAVQAAGCNP